MDSTQRELKEIRNRIAHIILEVEGVERDNGFRFKKSAHKNVKGRFVAEHSVALLSDEESVLVEPLNFEFSSKRQLREAEYELRDALNTLFEFGSVAPRMRFERRKEGETYRLYCVIEALGVKISYMPKWLELLNGVNRLIYTEYRNGKNKDLRSAVVELERMEKRGKQLLKLMEESD